MNINNDFNLLSLEAEIRSITKTLKKDNRKRSTKKSDGAVRTKTAKNVRQIKKDDSKTSSEKSCSNLAFLMPNNTPIKLRLGGADVIKEPFLDRLRTKRFSCRFCPKQSKSAKLCQKHKLSRLKGCAFGCKFCGEYFESKSCLVAHTRTLHSKLVVLDEITSRAVKGMLPNIHKFQNIFSKYSNLR